MIPKIEYKTNEILTNVFIPPFKDRKEFSKEAKSFILEFKKHEKEILKLIEKYSGFKWTKNKIPAYLVPPGKLFSMTKPNLERNTSGVIQKIYETNLRTIQIFIHELSHVNQYQSDFYSKKNNFIWRKNGKKDHVKIEICADIVTIHVIRELFGKGGEMEKEYWYFNNKLMTSTPEKKLQIPKYLKKLDLNKKPLKEYIIK